MLKLLVLDLDGTLLKDDKTISVRNLEVLYEAQEKGLRVAIGTGRIPSFVEDRAEQLKLSSYGGFVICNNGQQVLECATGRLHVGPKVPHEYAAKILAYAASHACSMRGFYQEERFEYDFPKREVLDASELSACFDGHDLDKICVFTPEKGEYHLEDDLRAAEEIEALCGRKVMCAIVYDHVVDVMLEGIDKAYGVRRVQEELGLEKEEILCMGDGGNDLSLALNFPFSAMANAMDMIKEHADRITLSNEEDGVAYEVERSFLKQLNSANGLSQY